MSAKAKALGLRKGAPDLCIPMPRSPHHGLYIEMKRKYGGVVSEDQRYWINVLRSQGYRAEVCCGFEAAMKVAEEYFGCTLKR